ncbi:uncharacterized protein EDB91DRAFT_1088659 [Suillus paluster]|uniref:uncharacterized protein n=1 Tax=Suillus paluster TaxID=48578 RepID=UPI001B86582D|nr:uncharacterized protein EDB91DRAFT_1088659 [Suillus paluster]KAG1720911.1 hypothetical protein EDB91DRAFT_1088659 [Suillus paluster]
MWWGGAWCETNFNGKFKTPVVIRGVPLTKRITCIFEVQQVGRCHQDKHKKSSQQTIKALCAVYRAHPEVFDEEPTKLHSDINTKEDTMQWKMPPSYSHLTPLAHDLGSSCKSIHLSASSGHDSEPDDNDTNLLNSDDELADDHDADEAVDDDDKVKSVAQSTKWPLDTTFEEPMMPKIKKGMGGSGQYLKAANFDGITKEILTSATTLFQCLIITQSPFPDSIIVETKLPSRLGMNHARQKASMSS